MEANHPFSPATAFPLSFFEEDMMLFTGSPASATDLAAAWADMGMGQGRSVSYIMDPYHLDINATAALGPTSPTLQSPLALLSPVGGRSIKKKRGTVDGMPGGGNTSAPARRMSESADMTETGGEDDAGGASGPAQKRRRRDTDTNGGSSGEETGDRRRDSSGAGDGKRGERPRLTEVEKKNNHIASEQKRRMAIRDGFDKLTELVPGIEGQGRSESIVLRKTVDHMRKVLEDRRRLIQQVQELGGEVPQELMLR
ncbi:hypothetical protein DRE_01531 [Drechslerella stenobrocha 248]|uniref:BHLH domain-containing protein n=1 Tax=Drechslerella stenobrocha 248 TaxID=1043628 RepID=W7HKU9_9PEZI|nr:hypothetical protein DRE_01531 [Drechslerella stenobrocha 248]